MDFGMAHPMAMWIIFCLMAVCSAQQSLNVGLQRNVTTKYPCGYFGEEVYYNHTEALWSSADREPKICIDDTFPSRYMVDGLVETFWQSSSRSRLYAAADLGDNDLDTIIEIDLYQEFSIQRINLLMSDSKRPNHIAVYKSLDGLEWTRFAYKVTIETECQRYFGVSLSSQPQNDMGYVCLSYGQPMANREEMQHYTVSELEVFADCTCNGLESSCSLNNATDRYECVCGGNSQGLLCESCLPLYNQQPYISGVKCQACQCNRHAESCSYNATIANASMSLNINNEYEGGSVCANCTDFTAGINCESCLPRYYRPANVMQNETTPCIPCECHPGGVIYNSNTGLLADCVINDNEPMELNNQNRIMVPGDCYCKEFVWGSKCDQCLPAYYNLSLGNPSGCQECRCYLAGTVNGSNICDSISGTCFCKGAVEGDTCDQCKDGYHSLTYNNAQGCESCDCDTGASYSPICNKTTAQCDCKPYTSDPQCKSVTAGYYYPDLDSLTIEPELYSDAFDFNVSIDSFGVGYVELNASWSSEFRIPSGPDGRFLSDRFDIYMRYFAEEEFTTNTDMATQSQVLDGLVSHRPCFSYWCYGRLLNEPIEAVTEDLEFVSILVNGTVRLDSIIILPHAFTTGIKDNITIDVPADCDLPARSVEQSISTGCEQYIFSMSMLYYGEGLPCDCNATGSESSICDQRGGRCTCKPGVGGRSCDRCNPGFYNLTSTGCQACACAGADKYCDLVTGVCTCSSTTHGRLCDKCVRDHWNWSPTGCQECGCDPEGSADSQCDLQTGLCSCKLGVATDKCTACQPEYYDAGAACIECACNVTGSLNRLCHNTTGQCFCKDNVVGRDCGSCADNSYYFGGDTISGCLQCDCMGITSECDSYDKDINEVFVDLSSATVSDLNASIAQEYVAVNHNSSVTVSSSQFYLKIASPPEGSLLLYYGATLQAIYQPSPILVSSTVIAFYLQTHDDSLVYATIPVTQGAHTLLEFNLDLLETRWRDPLGNYTTRSLFLEALQLVRYLYLPLNVGENTISISDVRFVPSPISPLLVEECSCGQEYLGLSCETCAYGHTRQPHENTSLGLCVPCECNDNALSCHVDTGECIDCQNNTAGFNCELCLPGFYGTMQSSRSACMPCPCYQIGTNQELCESLNDMVVCTDCKTGYVGNLCDRCDHFFWFNGSHCVPCNCNDNSAVCSYFTGECQNCENNTHGWNCEICAAGYYGDASLHNCTECGCDETGSTDLVCDHTTGECACAHNVISRTCDQCAHTYWNISITGCIPCNCEPSGSLSLQCDLITGWCECTQNATGYQCELCSLGSFGLPEQPCQDCGCNKTGSVNHTLPCNLYNGSCECLGGVGGRQCNNCMDMFYNFTNNGCTECGICERRLGFQANSLLDLGYGYRTYAEDLFGMVTNHRVLLNLTNRISTEIPHEADSVVGLQEEVLALLFDVDNLGNSLISNHTELNQNISMSINYTTELLSSVIEYHSGMEARQARVIAVSDNVSAVGDDINITLDYEQALNGTLSDTVNGWSIYWVSVSGGLAGETDFANMLIGRIHEYSGAAQRNLSDALLIEDRVIELYDRTELVYSVYEGLTQSTGDVEENLGVTVSKIYNSSAYFNISQLNYEFVEEAYQSAVLSINQSTSLLDQTLISYNDSQEETARMMASKDLLISGLQDRNFTILELQAALESSLLFLSELAPIAQNFTLRAESSTQLIGNLRLEELSAIRIYGRFVNASSYIVGVVDIARQLNSTLIEYKGLLSEETLSDLDLANMAVVNVLLNASQKLSAFANWSTSAEEDISRLADLFSNLSLVWREVPDNVTESSTQFAFLQSNIPNNTQLINVIEGNLGDAAVLHAESASIITDLEPILNSYENLGEILHNTTMTNQVTKEAITIRANETNQTVTSILGTSETVAVLESNHSRRMRRIEERLSDLEAKLKRAREWSKYVNRPTQIDYNDSIVYNYTAGRGSLDVSIEINLPNHEERHILNVVSSDRQDELVLSLIQDVLQVTAFSGENVVTLQSRAFVCMGCWVKVTVTSYDKKLSMLVSELETGARSVHDEYVCGDSCGRFDGDIQLSLGALAIKSSFNQTLIRNSGKHCIRNIELNSWSVNLSRLRNESSCCTPPEEPVTRSSVLSVSGFGYGYVKIPILGPGLTLSVVIRSYSPDGLIFSFLAENGSAQAKAVFARGKIRLEYTNQTAQSDSSSSTSRYYNYGEWTRLNCSANTTHLTCFVEYGALHDVLSVEIVEGFPVRVQQFLVGDDTDSVDRFAGCMANLTINGIEIDLWRDIGDSSGLLPYCYDKVLPGLSVEPNSIFSIPSTLISEDIYQLSVEFITDDATGSLVSVLSDNEIVEFGLIHSYLQAAVVIINGSTYAFQSTKRVSDYQVHLVTVKLNGSGFEVLLDGKSNSMNELILTPTSSRQQNDGSSLFKTGSVFLPVNRSFTGGITRLVVNEWTLPLLSSSIYSDHYAVRLSGIRSPWEYVLPPNLRTSPPPSTTPAPTCAPAQIQQYTSMGRRFGDESVSYATFDLTDISANFNRSVAITVRFRALTSYGLLFYGADSLPAPTQWIALHVRGGYLHFSAQTDSMSSSTIQSNFQYADGKWWTITLLRFHNFMALVVNGKQDYANNGKLLRDISHQNLGSELFVGGMTTEAKINVPSTVVSESFHGCIDFITFTSSHSQEKEIFNLTDPTSSYGTRSCYTAVVPGIYVTLGGYIHLASEVNVTIEDSFEFSVQIRSSERRYLLMAAVDSICYMAVFVNESQISVAMGHFFGGERLIFQAGMAPVRTNLCDALADTISVSINGGILDLSVGETNYEHELSFEQPWRLSRADIYIGSTPDEIRLPTYIPADGFVGCTDNFQLNGQSFRPSTLAATSVNVTIGCFN